VAARHQLGELVELARAVDADNSLSTSADTVVEAVSGRRPS